VTDKPETPKIEKHSFPVLWINNQQVVPFEDAAKLETELAAVKEELDNEQAKGIHSCGPNCKLPLCVLRKTINNEWIRLYGGDAVTDIPALQLRIQKIAEDRDCWAANVKANEKERCELVKLRTRERDEAVDALAETLRINSGYRGGAFFLSYQSSVTMARVLAKHNRVKIIEDNGSYVKGEWA